MPQDLTQDELDALSPQERAALEHQDDPPPAQDEDQTTTHHSVGTPMTSGEAPATAPQAAPLPDGGPEEEPESGPEPFAVPYQYDPGQFNLEAAQAAVKDLDQKFQDGDIDLNEYNAQRDAIREQITEHRVAAKISSEMGAQTAVARWQGTVDSFLDQKENAIYKTDEIRFIALNETVKRLARDPKNSNKSETWLLREGDRLVRASMGAAAAPRPLTPKEQAIRNRMPPKDIPPSLGDVPAAAPDSDDGEFSSLDALNDGTAEGQMRLEQALAKMSPEQQTRYLQS